MVRNILRALCVLLIFLVLGCATTHDLKPDREKYSSLSCQKLKKEISIVVGYHNEAVGEQGLTTKSALTGFLFGGLGANLTNSSAEGAEKAAEEQITFLYKIYDEKNCAEELYQLGRGSSQPSFPVPPPQSQQPPKAIKSAYSGTGFLFSAKDYVITNWHVVRGTNNIKVKFLSGENIEAEVALKDPQNDIAFLKLARQPQLPPSDLTIGDSSKMKMGDEVFTIGYPAYWLLGKNPKYTKGEVNALSGINDDPRVFQISVQIQPGNSGGPLFNSKGEVIGITQASLDPKVAIGTFGTLPQNVNYAIKSSYISTLLPMLPQTLIASRGIMVVPTESENTLANFIEKAKKNIVLIEAKE